MDKVSWVTLWVLWLMNYCLVPGSWSCFSACSLAHDEDAGWGLKSWQYAGYEKFFWCEIQDEIVLAGPGCVILFCRRGVGCSEL